MGEITKGEKKYIIKFSIQSFDCRQLLFISLHAFDFHFSVDILKESKFTQGMDFVLILRLHLPGDEIHYKVRN